MYKSAVLITGAMLWLLLLSSGSVIAGPSGPQSQDRLPPAPAGHAFPHDVGVQQLDGVFTILTPNAGTTWAARDTQMIVWQGGEPDSLVTLWVDNPGDFWGGCDIALTVPNTGQFEWTLPCQLRPGRHQIYIQYGYGAEGTVSEPFEVTNTDPEAAGDFTFLVPAGGETWNAGETHTIRWTGGCAEWQVHLALIFVDPFQVWSGISPAITNDRSFEWTIPVDVPTSDYYLYVMEENARTWSYGPAFHINGVHENSPPDCSNVTPSVDRLWPPNHDFRTIGVEGVTDADGDTVQIVIDGVTQDEETNTNGDGNFAPDARVVDGELQLRAERSGSPQVPGNGRVYTVHYSAVDSHGASCFGEFTVCVPHDVQDSGCVDDGQFVNSMVCDDGFIRAELAGVEPPRNDLTRVQLYPVTLVGGQASIRYYLPAESAVDLAVYDVRGRQVAVFADAPRSAGEHLVGWSASRSASGIYFARLMAGGRWQTQSFPVVR